MALARNLANGDAKTAINVTGTVAVAQGGTGLTAAPTNGQIDIGSTGVGFVRTTITQGSGISVTNSAGSITIANTSPSSGGTVTSVTGTSPVSVATGTTTPVISLAASYGDTQNPYASKTANFILAAPNGAAGVPTFRAVVAADIPALNQNTTGSSRYVAFLDTRATDDQPQGKAGYSLSLDFKNNTAVSNPPVTSSGTYSHVLTTAGWDTSGGSGGWPSQISVGDGIAIRQATSATVWGAWRTMLHSNNFTSYSPSLTGSGASGSWAISVTGNAATATNMAYSGLTGTIPTWNQNTTGTAANVTGTVAIANGGTGATTSSSALANLGAQATLVSGSNIRTVNGNSLLGSTDIVISASAGSDAVNVITTATTLVRYNTYVITAALTATLPITPTVGDWVVISNRSNVRTVTIARNGSNIMGLAENMTLDTVNPAFKLTYANATQGWVLI